MSESRTKTVFRMLMAWNDEREQRWLAEQERAGWRLRRVRAFGYTFEQAPPAEAAYRLDFGPPPRERAEYLALFRDAGWENLGRRGLWYFFRKPVTGDVVPEIYTDAASRIAMYRRVAAFMAVMLLSLVLQIAPRLASEGGTGWASHSPAFLTLQLLLAAVFAYGLVRLLLVISRLRRTQDADHGHRT
jgi:hypothetical protein